MAYSVFINISFGKTYVFVLLSIFLGMVVSDHPEPESIHRDKYHHYNQLMANNFQTWDTGPNFDTKLSQNVTAIHGRTTKLVCRVFNLGNKTVRTVSVSSHFNNFVFGCFWQQSYQNIT